MSLSQFFLETQIISKESEGIFALRLPDSDLKHAKALRLKPGEHIAVIDAAGDYFECRINSFSHETLMVSITQKQNRDPQGPTVVLVQGIARGEKMDSIIRQATELGVQGFVPFLSERSVVRLDEKKTAAKTKRWHEIAKSAAMQSGQPAIPEISPPLTLAALCEFLSNAAAVLICWEEETTRKLKDVLLSSLAQQRIEPKDARIAVVVGPEGGLSAQEVSALVAANKHAQTISLGPSILRTETAGILAPALVIYELGGLK